jgi:hypothetical protein
MFALPAVLPTGRRHPRVLVELRATGEALERILAKNADVYKEIETLRVHVLDGAFLYPVQ